MLLLHSNANAGLLIISGNVQIQSWHSNWLLFSWTFHDIHTCKYTCNPTIDLHVATLPLIRLLSYRISDPVLNEKLFTFSNECVFVYPLCVYVYPLYVYIYPLCAYVLPLCVYVYPLCVYAQYRY